MNNSHTPPSWRRRIAWRRPSHPLNGADDAHAARVGRPHGESHARDRAILHGVRAEHIIDLARALAAGCAQRVVVEQDAERIGIVRHLDARLALDPQPVAGAFGALDPRREQPDVVDAAHRRQFFVRTAGERADGVRMRRHDANFPSAGRDLMGAERGKRIGPPSLDESVGVAAMCARVARAG